MIHILSSERRGGEHVEHGDDDEEPAGAGAVASAETWSRDHSHPRLRHQLLWSQWSQTLHSPREWWDGSGWDKNMYLFKWFINICVQAAHHVSEALRYAIQYYKEATAGMRQGFGMGYGPAGPQGAGGSAGPHQRSYEWGGGYNRPHKHPKYWDRFGAIFGPMIIKCWNYFCEHTFFRKSTYFRSHFSPWVLIFAFK